MSLPQPREERALGFARRRAPVAAVTLLAAATLGWVADASSLLAATLWAAGLAHATWWLGYERGFAAAAARWPELALASGERGGWAEGLLCPRCQRPVARLWLRAVPRCAGCDRAPPCTPPRRKHGL